MNFQKGRYGIYIAREIGHFAYDLGIRRNHFCWVRDVKLLLDSNFHNFSNQYVSVAKENVFWSIIVKLDRPEMGHFCKLSQNLTKLVLLRPYRQYEARKYFLGIFRVSMWPR